MTTHARPTIYIASDHAGFEMKQFLVDALSEQCDIYDCGPETFDADDDYPKTIAPMMKKMQHDADAFGIVIGGSGQGEAMVANRYKGIRAVVYYGEPFDILTLSRQHNDANVLALAARFMEFDEALAAVRLWVSTPFSEDERHVRRITELDKIHHGA